MTDGATLRLRFGERVERLAQRAGISADDLAKRANLPSARLEEVLRGCAPAVTLREMDILAGVLATPLPDLLAPVDGLDRVVRGN